MKMMKTHKLQLLFVFFLFFDGLPGKFRIRQVHGTPRNWQRSDNTPLYDLDGSNPEVLDNPHRRIFA
jgi:hypothetical protein